MASKSFEDDSHIVWSKMADSITNNLKIIKDFAYLDQEYFTGKENKLDIYKDIIKTGV